MVLVAASASCSSKNGLATGIMVSGMCCSNGQLFLAVPPLPEPLHSLFQFDFGLKLEHGASPASIRGTSWNGICLSFWSVLGAKFRSGNFEQNFGELVEAGFHPTPHI